MTTRTRCMLAISVLYLYFPFFTSVLAYQWPGDPRYEALEQFIWEGTRGDRADLFIVLGGCAKRNIGDSITGTGTTVAATWLRMAYHDTATFNITDQTGGADGSIHFELDRAENIGDGLKLTQREYSPFPTKYISNADIIAIGAAGAVANCGGPVIPIRGGRVDAKEAGKPGVPEPQQDLQTHVEKFRLQGFNSTEMIELVACGHTMGGVESKDFPLIVEKRPTVPKLDSISELFDTTVQSFDTTVVAQYLDGTTENPLVISKNVTARSDLRIFNSDGNVTMRALSDPDVFQRRCATVFEKMINSVPAGVQLTDTIDVIPELPHHTTSLQIFNDTVRFTASLRLARPVSDPFLDGSNVSLYWCDRYGNDADCKSGFANRIRGSPEAFRMGGSPMMIRSNRDFRIYPFQTPIDPSRSISRFWWEIDQDGTTVKVDNNGEKFPIVQDEIIYAKDLTISLSSITVAPNGKFMSTNPSVDVVVGVRESINPTKVFMELLDNTFKQDIKPLGKTTNITLELVKNATLPAVPGYNLYSVHLDIYADGATMDFTLEVDGKITTLDYQPMSFGPFWKLSNPFVASNGTVERVAHTNTSPTPSPVPKSAAHLVIPASLAYILSLLTAFSLVLGSFL